MVFFALPTNPALADLAFTFGWFTHAELAKFSHAQRLPGRPNELNHCLSHEMSLSDAPLNQKTTGRYIPAEHFTGRKKTFEPLQHQVSV